MRYKQIFCILICSISLNIFASEGFALPANQKTESSKLLETKSQEFIDNLTEEDVKNYTYSDLRTLFLDHEWIVLTIDFEGYFSKKRACF